MSFTQPSKLPLMGPTPHGIESIAWTIVKYLAFYGVIHIVSSNVLQNLFPKDKLKKRDWMIAAERICSSFNSVYLTILAIKVLTNPAFWRDYQLPQAYPVELDHIYCMLAAYSIYDLLCMSVTGEHWSMWVHHVLSLWGAIAIMYYRVAGFYPTTFLITEITAAFSNLEWYCRKGLIPKHYMTSSTAKTILIASMWICRVWVGPYVFWASAKNCHGWSNWKEIWNTFPAIVRWGTGTNVALLTFLNTVWTLVLTGRWLSGGTIPDGQEKPTRPSSDDTTGKRRKIINGQASQTTLVSE